MSFIYDKAREILNAVKQIILANIDKTFPPDGVDLIDETLNGSKAEFVSKNGIEYRTHPLTRISSFFGLPNRRLRIYAGQSTANLFENFFGTGPEDAKSKYPRLRVTIITLLSILLTPLKLALNLPKIVTELIPGIFVDTFAPPFTPFSISLLTLALFFPWLVLKGIYFTGCCLTSSYDTLRSAWKEGTKINKPIAYILCGLCIFTTIIMVGYAFPIVTKIVAAKLAPILAHHLPTVIVNAVDKVAQVMTPAMTAIGKGFTYVINIVIAIANIPAAFGLPTLATVPALVGAGLFVAIAKATIGLQINAYIYRFKKWWHNEHENDPFQKEDEHTNILKQQMDILCALGVNNINPAENSTQPELYDSLKRPVELAELPRDTQPQRLAENPPIDDEKVSASSVGTPSITNLKL